MAVDEAILECFMDDDLPILRLYGWERSLSFGRFSDVSKNVNYKAIEKDDISCARRMSGGGILIHGGDLSYSLVLPRSLVKELGVKESYRYLCGFIIKLYEKLGFEADFASELNLESEKSNICMMSNEAYDIIIDGKKIGGNAQRHTKHTLFQHGSIPLSLDVINFEKLFLQESALNDVVTLEKLKSSITYEELKKLLINAFSKTFDVELIEDTLTPSQRKVADELLEKKYSSKRWNIHAKQT